MSDYILDKIWKRCTSSCSGFTARQIATRTDAKVWKRAQTMQSFLCKNNSQTIQYRMQTPDDPDANQSAIYRSDTDRATLRRSVGHHIHDFSS